MTTTNNRRRTNNRRVKRAQKVDFKLSGKQSKSGRDTPTQRRHQISKSRSSETTGPIWTKFFTGTLLFDGQHDAVDRIFGLPAVSNRVWLPPKKNPSKIKGRFRGPITRKVRAPAENQQRHRNGHGQNAEELGRLDFSENRFAAITSGENRKRVKNLTVKKRKNAWHRPVYKA